MGRRWNPEDQGKQEMRPWNKIGHKKPPVSKGQRFDPHVYSVRSFKQNVTCIATFERWLKNKYGVMVKHATPDQATAFLERQARSVGPKAVSQYRCALLRVHNLRRAGRELERRLYAIKSELPAKGRLATRNRAIPRVKFKAVQSRQSEANADASAIALAGRLRARELLTIAPAIPPNPGESSEDYEKRVPKEQRPTHFHDWQQPQFRNPPDGHSVQVVTGKGGLRRLQLFDREHSKILKKYLREGGPVTIKERDRGTDIRSYYTLPGGQAWSQSFSTACQKVFGKGKSPGGHGLRHTGAQDLMARLVDDGTPAAEALGAVSKDLGHKRPGITLTYLR